MCRNQVKNQIFDKVLQKGGRKKLTDPRNDKPLIRRIEKSYRAVQVRNYKGNPYYWIDYNHTLIEVLRDRSMSQLKELTGAKNLNFQEEISKCFKTSYAAK